AASPPVQVTAPFVRRGDSTRAPDAVRSGATAGALTSRTAREPITSQRKGPDAGVNEEAQLVVVALVPLELAHEFQQVLLFAPGNYPRSAPASTAVPCCRRPHAGDKFPLSS